MLAFPAPAATGAGSLRFENQPDRADHGGVEAELRWNVTGKTAGFVNYSYQKNEQEGTPRQRGQQFEFVYAPANKGERRRLRRAVLRHARRPSSCPGAASGWPRRPGVSWRRRRPVAALPGSPRLESYALLDSRISYDLPIGDRTRPLRLSLYLKNLLDKQPRETLVGVDTRLTGREFFAGLTVGF